MKSVLVTGGAGFIGSNLVHALLERGVEVRVLDNLSSGHLANLADVRDRITFVEGDIRDRPMLTTLCEGVDYILHQAAVPSVPRSVKDPWTSNDANVTGTLNVFLAARDAGVRRVVAASSSSVYGESKVLPKHEGMRPAPISPYAITKYVAELYGAVFKETFGMEIVCLRYFNVFGPRQDPQGAYAAVIPRFIESIREGISPTIFGDGTQTRDFCFIENVIQANLLACEAPDAAGRAFNVGCGSRITLLDLVEAINEELGTQIAPEFGPTRAGDVQHSLASIEDAESILGYTPAVQFREGLRKTVAWYGRSL
jgi:UDP-glucose 4-epimerase